MNFEKLSTVAHRRKFSLGLGVAQSPVASEKILPWPWRRSIRRFASLDPPLPALDPPLPVSTVRRLIRRCPSPPLATVARARSAVARLHRSSLNPPLPVATVGNRPCVARSAVARRLFASLYPPLLVATFADRPLPVRENYPSARPLRLLASLNPPLPVATVANRPCVARSAVARRLLASLNPPLLVATVADRPLPVRENYPSARPLPIRETYPCWPWRRSICRCP